MELIIYTVLFVFSKTYLMISNRYCATNYAAEERKKEKLAGT